VDTENQERIIEILEYCNKQQKTSLIFATHYLSQAQRLADCSIVLQNGSVSSAGNDNIFTVHHIDSNEETDTWFAGDDLPLIVPRNSKTVGQTICKIQINPRFIDISRSQQLESLSKAQWKGEIIRIASETEGARITVDCGRRVDVLLPYEVYTREKFMVSESVFLQIDSQKCVFL
jgi:ABC-type molybdate transport system ATPase subunit